MSVNAIRALILLGNLLLLGLVMWICYGTFVTVDKDRYFVEPPKVEKYKVPDIEANESQQKKDLYKSISRVFDHPPPPPIPVEKPQPVEAGPRADPHKIEILAMNVPINGKGTGSALINAPMASPKEPKYVQVGMDLAELPELKEYKGVKVKAITSEGAVFTDQKGLEVKIPGPRQGEKK